MLKCHKSWFIEQEQKGNEKKLLRVPFLRSRVGLKRLAAGPQNPRRKDSRQRDKMTLSGLAPPNPKGKRVGKVAIQLAPPEVNPAPLIPQGKKKMLMSVARVMPNTQVPCPGCTAWPHLGG